VVSYIGIPVFPSCQNSNNVSEMKKCFSKGIQQHFAQKFDAELPNRLGLASGRLRIFINFKIDKQGKVVQIRTKLSKPSLEIKAEVLRVLKLVPKMMYAPMHNGKAVNIKYSITLNPQVNN
jgi:hypothetical protein